jgi:hypothetical protein
MLRGRSRRGKSKGAESERRKQRGWSRRGTIKGCGAGVDVEGARSRRGKSKGRSRRGCISIIN